MFVLFLCSFFLSIVTTQATVTTVESGLSFENPYSASISNDLKSSDFKIDKYFNRLKKRKLEYIDPDNQKEVKLSFHHQAGSNNQQQQWIVIPGLFSNSMRPYVYSSLKKVAQRGDEIFILPNTWSLQFGNANDYKYVAGKPSLDSRKLYQAILELSEAYQLKKRSIKLLGFSYGAFLASLIKLHDLNGAEIFTDDVTLISPPINAATSIARFNQLIKDEAQIYNDLNVVNKLFIARDYKKARNDNDLSEKTKASTVALFVYEGFQKYLVDYFKKAGQKAKCEIVDFDCFYKKYHSQSYPAAFEASLPRHSLAHWTEELINSGISVNLLFDLNDPINTLENSTNYIHNFEDEDDVNIYLFDRGGHVGFVSSEAFRNIVTDL